MKVVIGTYPSGEYEWVEAIGQRVELHIAEVIEPSTFWAGKSGVLYASPPRFRLNAAANALDWARRNGHEVMAGDEAKAAIALN